MVRHVRVRRWTACGLPVVLVLLLGACSGSSDPKVLPLPTLSSTALPSPTPLVVPSAAAANTPQGAAAFARFYFDAVNKSFQNRSGSTLREISASSCKTCMGLASAADRLAAADQRLRGGVYTVLSAEAPPLEGSRARVDVVYRRTAATTVDRLGTPVGTGPEELPTTVVLTLTGGPKGWMVAMLRVFKP